ncbi:MAG: proprotein convertase P-domain-containing protein [Chitinophagales bacterium]
MYSISTTHRMAGVCLFFSKIVTYKRKIPSKLFLLFLLFTSSFNPVLGQCADNPNASIPDGVALGLLNGSYSSYVINVDSEGLLNNAGGVGTTSISSVCVAIEHSVPTQIEIYLTSPQGTTIELSSGNGSAGLCFSSNNYGNYSGANPVELCFVDGAAQNITSYCAGSNGQAGDWNPENGFDAFDGESPIGAWILSVEDNFIFTTGTFDSWSINFSNGDCTADCNANAGTAAIVGGFDSSLCCNDDTQAEVSGDVTDSGYDIFWTLSSGATGASSAADVAAGEAFGQGTSSDVLTYDCDTRPAGTYTLTPYIATDGTNGTDVQVFQTGAVMPNISLGGSLSLDVSNVPFDASTSIDFDVIIGGSAVDLYLATYNSPQSPILPININLNNRYNNLQTFTGNPNGTYSLNFLVGVNLIFDPTNIDIVVTVRNIPAGYIDLDCSAFGTPVSLTLSDPTTATASSNSPVCLDGNLSLMGMGGNSYSWSGPNSFVSGAQNPTINNVAAANAGTYIVTVTDDNGCTDSASTSIVVNDPPTATANSNSPVCENETINLTSSGGTSYIWGGPNSFSFNGQNPNIANTQMVNAGTYTVTVTDGNGCSDTAETTVVVTVGATATAGSNSAICVGEAINLTSNGGTSYIWAGPNSFSFNGQNPSIPNAQSVDAGTYTVTVTDGNSCSDTAETTVVINQPTAIAGSNSPVCPGDDLNLTSSGGVSYSWTGPNSFTSNLQNPTINSFSSNNVGSYTVVVTDANDCTNSASTTVTEDSNPLTCSSVGCLGFAVIALAGDCDDATNTYDLTVTVTKPPIAALLGIASQGYELFVNGTSVGIFDYDLLGLVSIETITGLSANETDGLTGTVTVVDLDGGCTSNTTFLEPILCFDLDCMGFAVVAAALECGTEANSYDVEVVVTNPNLLGLLGSDSNGFELYINGNLIGVYEYDGVLAGALTTINVPNIAYDAVNGLTGTVEVRDTDGNCVANSTYLEPIACLDLDCLGFNVVGLATECGDIPNTFDLIVTTTNPNLLDILGSDASGFEIFVNGTSYGTYQYDGGLGGLLTIDTLENVPFDAAGDLTGTVSLVDLDGDCTASTTFAEPILCLDLDCLGFAVVGVPLECGTESNAYNLQFAVTHPAFLTTIGALSQGFELYVNGELIDTFQYANGIAGLVTIDTVYNVSYDAISGLTGTIEVRDLDGDCTVNSTYIEPITCIDLDCLGLAAVAGTINCGSAVNTYDLEVLVTNPNLVDILGSDGQGFELFVNGSSVGTYDYSGLAGLITNVTVEGVPFDSAGGLTGTIQVVDLDNPDCSVNSAFLEPLVCFGTDCDDFDVDAVAGDCDENTNTYALTVTVTNPAILDALGATSQGFELSVNGNVTGTFAYDLTNSETVINLNVAADESIGLTGTVSVTDLDADCTDSATYLEPILCFDLDCLGFAVVATALECGTEINTYDLEVVVTNPNLLGLLGSDAQGFELYVNDVLIGSYDYQGIIAGELTTITVENVPYDQVNELTGTVEVRDLDGECVANSTFLEPIACLDLDCLGYAVAATATECGTVTNTYNVDIIITNPSFLGLLGDDDLGYSLSINGTSYGTFAYDAGLLTTLTIENVPFDAIGDLTGTVSIQDLNNTDCLATVTYVEPIACLDLDCIGFAIVAAPTGCGDVINTYDLEVIVTNPDLLDVLGSSAQGFELFINGTSYGTYTYQGIAGALTTINVENVPYDSNGGLTGTVEAIDLDENCTVNSTYLEPIACLDLDCLGFAVVAGTIECGTAVNTYNLQVLVTNPNLLGLLGSDAQGFELIINGNSVGTYDYTGIAGAITIVTINGVQFDSTGGLTGTIEANDLDGDCTASSTFLEPLVCFGTDCDDFDVDATPTSACDGINDTYDLTVTVTNPEIVDILGTDSQGFQLTVNGTVVGTFDYNLSSTSTVVTVTATSSGNTNGSVSALDLDANCTDSATYTEPDCPNCNVTIDTGNVTTTCDSDGTYDLTFTVTYNNLVGSNGFNYSINGGTSVNVAYNGSGSQSITINDLTGNGTSAVSINIEDADDSSCNDSYSFTAPNCPICNLSFTAIQQACQGNGTYNLTLNVTHSNTLTSNGFTYSVNGATAVAVAYSSGSSQTVSIPNLIGDGNSVTVVLTDQTNSTCTASQTYTAQICPNLCDFDASVSVMQSGGSACQADNTHTINLTVSYDENVVGTQGFNYSIDGGIPVNVAYDGSGLQVIQITGLASNGQNSTISVSDAENENICNASADYTAPICPDCSISVTGITSTCQFDGSYDLTFTVNYNETVGTNGFNYSINGSTSTNVAYNDSGSQTVTVTGLSGNGGAATIAVTDAQNTSCSSGTVNYSAPNCPSCGISVSGISSNCQSDGTYDLTFTISYNSATGNTGFNYIVNGGTQVNVPYNGTGSQVVTVQNLAGNGGSGTIQVTDAQFPSCGSGAVSYTAPSCPVCDIIVSASPTVANCNSDGTYNLSFTVTYNELVGSSGFQYSINGGTATTVAYNGTGSQTVTVNNLSGNGTTTSIVVNDIANPSCSGNTSFVAPTCPLCNLAVNASQGICQGDGTYDLALVVTYNNTVGSPSFIYSVNGGTGITVNYNGTGQQNLSIENLVGDGTTVNIVLTDLLNPTCTTTASYTSQVCNVVCDLEPTIDAIGTCQADDTFSLTFTVTYGDSAGDNGFNYIIGNSSPVNVAYDGSGSQTITVDGIAGTGQAMNVTVTDVNNADCANSSSFNTPLCPLCDLNIGSDITANCNDDGTYDLTFTVNYNSTVGNNGFTYSINGANNTSVAYDDSGSQTVVVVGLIGDGNDITIAVNDANLTDCSGDTATFTAPVCETCNISVATSDILTECNGSGTYDLTFTVTYNDLVGSNGFNYSINGGSNVNVAYDGSGSQTVTVAGLIGNGSFATIEVTDESNAACSSGVVNYQSPVCESCMLSIAANNITTQCQDDGTYTLSFVVTYNDLVGSQGFIYSLNGGASVNVAYDGSGEQTVNVTGLQGNGGAMSISASDVEDSSCNSGFVNFNAPNCDVCSVAIVPNSFNTNCFSDGTFTLTFDVSYNNLVGNGGFNYTIDGGTPVNLTYNGSGQQTVTVIGLIGDGTSVAIAVSDANNANCAGDSVDFIKPTCGVCDLSISSTSLACQPNGMFDVALVVTYSNTLNSTGFSYSVNGGAATNVFYNGLGIQTVLIQDLVGNGSSITIDVIDNVNANCTATTTFISSNCPVLCGLDVSASVEAAAISCQPDNTYSLTLNVTYDDTVGDSGFNYSINGGTSVNVAYDGTGSQVVVISGLPGNGDLVEVEVEDAANSNCFATDSYLAPECPACNINVALVSQDCQSNGTNTLTFSVSYNQSVGSLGFNYSINGGALVNVPYTSVIGVQTLVVPNVIGDGSNINIEVSDAQFDDCDGASLTFASAICELCTLNVAATASNESCLGDGTYTLQLDVSYNNLVGGSGFLYSINGGAGVIVDYNGTGLQTILLSGMIGDGSTVSVEVWDAINQDCGGTATVAAPICNLCDLIVSSSNVDTECQDDGTYTLSFLVNHNTAVGGSGFQYSIEGSTPVTVPYNGSGSQFVTVSGLLGNGSLNQTIEVNDVQFPDCSVVTQYTAPNCSDACSLSLSTIIGDCDGESYDVTLNVTYENPKGLGFNYSVNNGPKTFVAYNGSGLQTVTIPNLAGLGTATSITVSDSANPNCSANTSFLAPFCSGECKINAVPERFCNGDGTFDLALIVTYQNVGQVGFEYSLDGADPTLVDYDGSGVQVLLFPNLSVEGPAIFVTIYDKVQQACDKSFIVVRPNCEVVEGECDVNITVFPDANCVIDNTYSTLVIVDYANPTGTSFTYTIDGELGGTVDYDGIGLQTLNLEGLIGDGGFTTIEVFDTDNPTCSDVVTYSAPDCGDETNCSIEVDTVVGLCEEGDTYDLTLVVTYDNVLGTGFNYSLSDNLGTDYPAGVLAYDGSGLQTITFSNLIGNGSAVQVSVSDNLAETCSDQLSFDAPKCPEDGIDGCALVIQGFTTSSCNSDGTFNFTFVVSHNNNVGDNGFNYSINGGSSTNVAYVANSNQSTVTVTMEGNGESVNIEVVDADNPTCGDSLVNAFTAPDCGVCSLSVTAVPSSNCAEDGTYSLVLIVNYENTIGSGFTYQIGEDQIGSANYDNTGQQFVTVTGLTSDVGSISVMVTDVGNESCMATASYMTPNCEEGQVCDLNFSIFPATACDENGNYSVAVLLQYDNVGSSPGFNYVFVDSDDQVVASGSRIYDGNGLETFTIGGIQTFESLDITVIITDIGSSTCTQSFNYLAPDCAGLLACTLNSAGICNLTLLQKAASLEVCPFEGVQAEAIGVILLDNSYELGFMLYTNIADPFGSMLALNKSGQFFNDGSILGVPLDETIYVTSVLLKAPFGSIVDSGDDCVKLGLPAEAIFLSRCDNCPILASDEVICASVGSTYQVALYVGGGSGPYEVLSGGILKENVTEGSILGFGPFSSTATYSVVITDANGCAQLISGDGDLCTTLPVDLIEFTGEVLEEGNLLKWVTASELNNDYFVLEHSMDGQNYEVIAEVDGQGTTSEVHSYDFMHRNAPIGLSYYRLSQIDFDGERSAYSVITLRRKSMDMQLLNIRPVPSDSWVTITFINGSDEDVTLTIHSVDGRWINTQTLSAKQGVNEYTIDISAYASGLYHLQLANGREVINAKIMRE